MATDESRFKANLTKEHDKKVASKDINFIDEHKRQANQQRMKVSNAIAGGGANNRKLDKVIEVEGNGTGPSILDGLKQLFTRKPKPKKPASEAKPSAPPPVEGVVRYDYSTPKEPPPNTKPAEKVWPPLSADMLDQCSFKLMRSEVVAGEESEGPQAVLLVRIKKSADDGHIEDIEDSLGKYKAQPVAIDDERFHKTGYQITGDGPVADLLIEYKPAYSTVPGLKASPGLSDRIKIHKDAQSLS